MVVIQREHIPDGITLSENHDRCVGKAESSFRGLGRHFECDFVQPDRQDYYMNCYMKLGLLPEQAWGKVIGTVLECSEGLGFPNELLHG
ncbi:MAG: hypothetical protein QOF66_1796 [Mycobacterium sp.]|nr:hypothetical protein [Mycobacterium sp.]